MNPDAAKQIVASGYDRCAQAYAAARALEPGAELALLRAHLPPPARILDVGCGAGLPVTAALARMGTVIGVDISEAQIALARANVPEARFIHGDIMSQTFDAASFDAIVACYSLFHLPRDEQRVFLNKVLGWLRPGGCIFATLPHSDHAGYTEDDFFGVTMYWSQHEPAWYHDQFLKLGFEILHFGELGHGFHAATGLPPERHPVILARAPREPDSPHRGS
jgi:SAM-dependent methyltransferase